VAPCVSHAGGQVEGILGLPELYRELPGLFEYRRFESDELTAKARTLERLLHDYAAGHA